VAGALPGQGIRKGRPHRPVFVADQQINVRNLVPFACQRLANIHRHGSILLWLPNCGGRRRASPSRAIPAGPCPTRTLAFYPPVQAGGQWGENSQPRRACLEQANRRQEDWEILALWKTWGAWVAGITPRTGVLRGSISPRNWQVIR
jgi:hypothetical protein